MQAKPSTTIRYYLIALVFSLSGLVVSSVQWGWFYSLDLLMYDQVIKWEGEAAPTDVIIVAIDENSLNQIGQWPWSRSYHAQLINKLTAAGVKAIGYDFVFAEPNRFDPKGDRLLETAIKESRLVVLPVYVDRLQQGGQLIEVLPHPMFAEYARMGHVNTALDVDGMVRSLYLKEGIGLPYWHHFSYEVARLAGYPMPNLPTEHDLPSDYSPLVNRREHQRYLRFVGGVGSFQQVSFHDVISGVIPADLFKDKIVFVGATSITLGDLLPTPVTNEGEQMPGVEINANAYVGSVRESFIRGLPIIVQIIVSLVLVVPAILLIPRLSAPATLATIVAFLALSYGLMVVMLVAFGYWLQLASAMLGIALVYPSWTVLRLDQTLRYLRIQVAQLHQQVNQSWMGFTDEHRKQSSLEMLRLLLGQLGVKRYDLVFNGELLDENIALPDDLWVLVKAAPYGETHVDHWRIFRYTLDSNDIALVIADENGQAFQQASAALLTAFFEHVDESGQEEQRNLYDVLMNQLRQVRNYQTIISGANQQLLASVDEMDEGVVIANQFGFVLFANKKALRLLQKTISRDEVRTLSELLENLKPRQNDQHWEELFQQLILSKRSMEKDAVAPNGAELILNSSCIESVHSEGRLLVVNLSDVSRIRDVQRMRNETIDFLSHDMRSPISSLLALVQQRKTRTDGEGLEFLEQIERYAEKNLHFTEQFLQLARVENDEPLQTYLIDLEEVAQNAVDDCFHLAKERGMHISFDVHGEDFWTEGNGELLERVIVNLLTNAIKYAPEHTAIHARLYRQPGQLRFSVEDHGAGVPEEKQPYLFAPYKRVHGNTKAKGAGLGLRFVFVTIKRHGGNVYFMNMTRGAKFGFILPMNEK